MVLRHHVIKINEERLRIVRTRRCFRMVLHRKDRLVFETQALDRLVIQINLSHDGTVFFQFLARGGEAVILRRDGNFARLQVFHGLIAATVAKFEFEGLRSQGVGDDLMPQANPKGGITCTSKP